MAENGLDEIKKKYGEYPVSIVEYKIEAIGYRVFRHFCGDTDLNATVGEIAVKRTSREMGLTEH